MSPYVLYGRGESGNSYKVALMLTFCGVDWEPRLVLPLDGESKASFKEEVNPFGEVPVLEAEGLRLTQSGAILTWLAERTGRFGGRDDAERLEILRWLLFDNHKFTNAYATSRVLIGFKKLPESALTEFFRAQAHAALEVVEKHLAESRFIVGDEPTIADFSMVGYLYYDEETGIDMSRFPNINAWTDRIAAQPGWRHPYALLPRAG